MYKLFLMDWQTDGTLGLGIVNSISLLVIAVAIFDVAKYLIQQEVL